MSTEVAGSQIGLRLPFGRALSRADLQGIPEDGHRYELIDGTLIVSPSPRTAHQIAVGNLYLELRSAAPDGLLVIVAPFDVVLDDATVVIPDLVVAPADQFTERDLPGAPLLAVEVLSPSTRGVDLLLKKERYARSGVRHYWVIDPEGPSVIAWRLADDGYVDAGRAVGDEALVLTEPFALELMPSRLLG